MSTASAPSSSAPAIGLQITPPPTKDVVTWIASYPRSGNTLLRSILKRSFGLVSQSIYGDEDFVHPVVAEIVGQDSVGPDPIKFLADARDRGKSLYVKTHEMPGADGQKTIYVVRDGRSSVVSHFHYAKQILRRAITLRDVISGVLGPTWSQHVNAWAFSNKPNTLIVRYEELKLGNGKTLKSISDFIGQPLVRDFYLAFDELKKLDPKFFRCGSDSANLKDFDSDSAQLFERLHGQTLRRIGYGS